MGILALPSATMALSLFLWSACSAAQATEATVAHDRPGESGEQATGGTKAAPLSVNSSIREILNHPAFSGFGRRILPWEDRPYDENMPLVEISGKGYNAFVLKYRAGHGGTVATQDLAAAISYIFDNADQLGVSTQSYSLWGSSAGARMAASIGSHGGARFGGKDLPKPSAVVMTYTAHSDFSTDEPPTFVAVGEQDGISPPSAMEQRIAALRRAGTEVEYRKYPNLGHGFGPGTGTSAEGWVADAIQFWGRQ